MIRNLRMKVGALGTVSALLGGLWALQPPTAASQTTSESYVQCEASFEPQAIAAGEESVRVSALLSEAVGRITAVTPATESGLRVASAEAADPQNVSLVLNASAANAGTWPVEFRGDNGSCNGEITVQGGLGQS